MVLEADKVVAVGADILLAQLHHGPRCLARARIAQAYRLHGAEAQGVAAAAGENFNRQTAFKIVELLPLFRLGGLGLKQRVKKAIELLAVHGAIDVVCRSLVPARGHVDAVHVDGVGVDNRRDRVVKGQVAGAGEPLDLAAEGVRRQRTRGEDCERICRVCFKARDCFADDTNQRLGGDGFRDQPRKLDAIDSQGVARRDCGQVCNAKKSRSRPAHLLLQQPGRGVGRFALEGVGTDQLSKIGGLVGWREARLSIHYGAHLVEIHLAAEPRGGECSLGAGQPATNHAYLQFVCSAWAGSIAPTLASRSSASPLTRTLRHSSRNSAPIAL